MALPRPLRPGLTPAELTFIATSETTLEIVPNFRMGQIRLLSGVWGPFEPPRKATVPLWLALDLKRKKQCTIVPPDWLSVEALQEKLSDETSHRQYSALPFRYIEIARAILEAASDDLLSPAHVRSLLKDIREVRQSKTREGVLKMNADGMQMTGIAQMEVHEIRPFFVKSFGMIRKLGGEGEGDEESVGGPGTGDDLWAPPGRSATVGTAGQADDSWGMDES